MNRTLNLLFILHFPPPIHGSAVIGGFIKESKTINEAFNCRFINLGTSSSVEDIGRNSLRKMARYLLLICRVSKQLVLFRPDLCYITPTAQGTGFYKDALVIALVKIFGVKTIYHYHNKGVSIKQERLFDNLLYRFVFRKTRVILLSKHLYPDIQKYVPESMVFYCPNGLPDSKGKRQKAKGKSEGDVVEILFLSHLIKTKGVYVFIDALKILKERNLAFHCTMIGGEGDISEKELRSEIEKWGLSDNANIGGKKYGEEKNKAFEMADIFVHPTYNDCLPLVLLEAMQNSLPVVSTFEGAIPDVVNDGITGFMVPQRDAAALADRLEILIKDPVLRERMGAAGRAKYENEFTLEKFENRLKEILEDVVKKGRDE